MTLSPYLRLDAVSKLYHIREPRLASRAARAMLASWLYEKNKDFWALRDISLELKPGQMLGIIGMNGSGKSTLLKIIAGVTGPTSGTVESRGSMVGLLELGAGFHPDLTGYQNIYLQCNLMGLRKAEIDERLQSIVDFSGLHEALEWPVKRYSSGMYARLGFSLALHAGANIILIDEILAVGDAEFQRRGLARIREIQDRGDSIIILVTHDIYVAREFCDELMWLDHGRIQAYDKPDEVFREYWERILPQVLENSDYVNDRQLFEKANANLLSTTPLRIKDVHFLNKDGEQAGKILAGEPASLALEVESEREIDNPAIDVYVVSKDQIPIAEMHSRDLPQPLCIPRGASTIVFHMEPQLMLDNVYSATALIAEQPEGPQWLAAAFRQGELEIISDPPQAIWNAMTHPHRWEEIEMRDKQ